MVCTSLIKQFFKLHNQYEKKQEYRFLLSNGPGRNQPTHVLSFTLLIYSRILSYDHFLA